MEYYRRNLLVLSGAVFLVACGWNQVVPFLPLFLKELGVRNDLPFWSGLIFAAQWAAIVFSAPFWGKLADKYGRKLMVLRAGFCLVLIYFGMSICRTFWQLALLRLANGFFAGFIPAAITLIATNTPQTKSSRYVSITQSANAAGTIAGPAIGGFLAAAVGYRFSMTLSAIVVGIAVILVFLFVTEKEKPQLTDNTSLWQDYRLAFKIPILQTAILGELAGNLILASVLPILALYIEKITGGNSDMVNGLICTLPGLAFVFTAYNWSKLGEKISYQAALLIGLAGVSIFIMLQGLTGNIWLFGLIYFMAGIFGADVSPSTAALVNVGVTADFRGRAFGIHQGFRSFGFFLAPLFSGLVGNFFGLNMVFLAMGIFGLFLTGLIHRQIRTWAK